MRLEFDLVPFDVLGGCGGPRRSMCIGDDLQHRRLIAPGEEGSSRNGSGDCTIPGWQPRDTGTTSRHSVETKGNALRLPSNPRCDGRESATSLVVSIAGDGLPKAR